MIDIGQERCMPLRELKECLPVTRSVRSLYRYATLGARHRKDKRQVVLESVIVGGEMQSSVEAFYRFVEKLSAGVSAAAREPQLESVS